MNEAIGYVRVSSEEQADSGLGLQAQRQRILAFCAMKGLRLAEVFEDAAVSGGKPLSSRPSGSRLLNAARRGKVVVVVAKLDRLFRSVADAANVIADFDKKGIQLVAIAEGFDRTNPYGRAMAQMASVFAELERAMIRERTRSAMDVKRSRGERISGHAPFGWDFGPDGSFQLVWMSGLRRRYRLERAAYDQSGERRGIVLSVLERVVHHHRLTSAG